MARGRKPTDPKLKLIAGTFRADRDQVDVPEFDILDSFPDAPLHLNRDGIDMWEKLGPQLVSARVLQVVDLYPLEQLCYTWQLFRQKAKAGIEPTAAENQALKSLFSEFGMTPASRKKISSSAEASVGNKFNSNGRRKTG